jgi:phage baseplate assembly protein W
MMKIIYKGFSTHEYVKQGGTFSLTNVDLVNLDILNHIYTGRDERVMMPGWGTIIQDTPFEQLTQELLANIRDDLERVFEYDPRVKIISLTITPYADYNTIVASAFLQYIELDTTDTLNFVINLESV